LTKLQLRPQKDEVCYICGERETTKHVVECKKAQTTK